MNEWMFNDTPARKTDRLLGVSTCEYMTKWSLKKKIKLIAGGMQNIFIFFRHKHKLTRAHTQNKKKKKKKKKKEPPPHPPHPTTTTEKKTNNHHHQYILVSQ